MTATGRGAACACPAPCSQSVSLLFDYVSFLGIAFIAFIQMQFPSSLVFLDACQLHPTLTLDAV